MHFFAQSFHLNLVLGQKHPLFVSLNHCFTHSLNLFSSLLYFAILLKCEENNLQVDIYGIASQPTSESRVTKSVKPEVCWS